MEVSKRQHGLDGIKVLGMYLVILYHVLSMRPRWWDTSDISLKRFWAAVCPCFLW